MKVEDLKGRFKNDRGRDKMVYLMCDPIIKSAYEARPDQHGLKGMFFATGVMVYHDTNEICGDVQTSLIVSGSIAEGYVETLNSVYMFVDRPVEAKVAPSGVWGSINSLMANGADE